MEMLYDLLRRQHLQMQAGSRVRQATEEAPEGRHSQRPEVLLIGCSECQDVPAKLRQSWSGEIYSYRNLGNQVRFDDKNTLAVIEYAVYHLNVRRIVILGDYGCQLMQAALRPAGYPPALDEWLADVRWLAGQLQPILDRISHPTDRVNFLAEQNTLFQVWKLRRLESLQNLPDLEILPMMLDPEKGTVRRLEALLQVEQATLSRFAPVMRVLDRAVGE